MEQLSLVGEHANNILTVQFHLDEEMISPVSGNEVPGAPASGETLDSGFWKLPRWKWVALSTTNSKCAPAPAGDANNPALCPGCWVRIGLWERHMPPASRAVGQDWCLHASGPSYSRPTHDESSVLSKSTSEHNRVIRKCAFFRG